MAFNIDRPDKDIPMPAFSHKVIAPYLEEDIKAFLKAYDYTSPAKTGNRKGFKMRRPTATRDKALIFVLLDTGLRVSECARPQLQDLDLKSGEIMVRPDKSGKKSKSRTVYIGTRSHQAVWYYLADRDARQDDPLFVTRYGRGMSRDSIRQLLKELGKRSGVSNVHAHRFRQIFAIQYLRNGGDVFTLQRLLDHSSLEMVRRYLSIADTDSAEAHRRASPAQAYNHNP
jgi:integrase/recombinase XerD